MKHIFHIVPALLTWLLLILTFIGGLGRLIPPEVWTFPQLLCLALPVFAVLSLGAGTAWLCKRHLVLPIATAIVLLGISPSLAQIFPVSFSSTPPQGAPTLSIISYNTHGFRDNDPEYKNTGRALDYILASGADIVCMQEVYGLGSILNWKLISQQQYDKAREIYPYSACHGNKDVSVYAKYPVKRLKTSLDTTLVSSMCDIVEVDKPGFPFTIVNVHLASFGLADNEVDVVEKTLDGKKPGRSKSKSVYRKLTHSFELRAHDTRLIAEAVREIKGTVILCGDFNDVPASYSYNTIRKAGLEDAYLDCCFGPTATYNAHRLYFHIDQMFYRGKVKPLSVTRGDIKASDHYPLLARFQLL